MIEHLRDVAHAGFVEIFGQPQQQVVVLAALEAGTQAAEPAEGSRADHAEMVHVVLGPEQLAVVIRFEMRLEAAAARIDLVLVAVNQLQFRVGAQGSRHFVQGVLRQ